MCEICNLNQYIPILSEDKVYFMNTISSPSNKRVFVHMAKLSVTLEIWIFSGAFHHSRSELLMELNEIPNGLPILNDRRMGMDRPTN